jgi:hypothetical protein
VNRSAFEIANEKISIAEVCTLIGMDMPDLDYMAASPKMHCPFGFMHSDEGYDKAFRAYGETNSAYCFACAKRWSPVSLYADAEDLRWVEAAEILLEKFGISRETVEDRWEDLTKPKSFVVSTSELAESLRLFCARICPTWETRQFEEDTSALFNRCLSLLNAIYSEDDVSLWRERTKQIMRSHLT